MRQPNTLLLNRGEGKHHRNTFISLPSSCLHAHLMQLNSGKILQWPQSSGKRKFSCTRQYNPSHHQGHRAGPFPFYPCKKYLQLQENRDAHLANCNKKTTQSVYWGRTRVKKKALKQLLISTKQCLAKPLSIFAASCLYTHVPVLSKQTTQLHRDFQHKNKLFLNK